ncbi:Bifunctional protein FolD 2 [Dichanthelium oligosanthes]|uniref:methenyltetrahydrofolate cyclohydrolase n=1 Tax=Dichanthelium oligosanthes TaxID=888268 RepID=A0A1E5UMG6_9POAL|nr:Bifunctional protein FolD 2 [Dichanthelium oligosanthes]
MAQIIDGKAIAADIRREVAAEAAALASAHNIVPGLAVVIVGSRKDSQTYVNMKRKACAEVGIRSIDLDLPEDISELALVAEVHRLNADPAVHGILVQLPLPKHINEEKILSEISIEKDVDGFHPLNIGKLAMKGRQPLFLPCTPKIKGDWIKPGAAVIDVGTNSVDDPTRKSGYRLVGDVDFAEVSKVAGYLTPVPGGVGPMTVAMLLKNTVDGAKWGIVE